MVVAGLAAEGNGVLVAGSQLYLSIVVQAQDLACLLATTARLGALKRFTLSTSVNTAFVRNTGIYRGHQCLSAEHEHQWSLLTQVFTLTRV